MKRFLSLVICVFLVFGSVIGCALGGIVVGIGFACHGNALTGVALVGTGIVCAGLSIFLFYGCNAVTKGTLLLTKKIALGIKNRFVKKGEAQ